LDNIEFVDFILDHLHCRLDELPHFMLDPAALYDPLPLFNRFVLSALDDSPQVIAEHLEPLQELLFGLLVFSEIRELLRELVEALDEFCDLHLFGVRPLQELDEAFLSLVEALEDRFFLPPHLPEDVQTLLVVDILKKVPHVFLLFVIEDLHLLLDPG